MKPEKKMEYTNTANTNEVEAFSEVSAFETTPASVEEVPPQAPQQKESPRQRRSLEDVYAGVRELYLWLISQSPSNTIVMGGGLGFLHGCIWAILFPRFTTFILFLLASSIAGLAGIAYRDIDMTPRQRDSITICGFTFGILAFVMFIFWIMT